MRSVVFRTPGKLDLRSVTMFGVNVKPNSQNPIGYFGTGLKYAIAGCLRLGYKITLYQAGNQYDFRIKSADFRGSMISPVIMTKKNKILFADTELPFTSDLGKNWQPWQIFREFYANTLDEDGDAYIVELFNDPERDLNYTALKEYTIIVVEGEDFAQEYLDREKTFLPEGLRKQADNNEAIQWWDRPSQHIYYRGLRVMDLEKTSTLTYNILSPIELTEDRTAKNQWAINHLLAKAIVRSTDKTLIERVVTAAQGKYERGFNYEYLYETPTPEFMDVVESFRAEGEEGVNASASVMVKSYRPPPPKPKPVFSIEALVDSIRSKDESLTLELISQERTTVMNWLVMGNAWYLENPDINPTNINDLADKYKPDSDIKELGFSGGADELPGPSQAKSDQDDHIPF